MIRCIQLKQTFISIAILQCHVSYYIPQLSFRQALNVHFGCNVGAWAHLRHQVGERHPKELSGTTGAFCAIDDLGFNWD